MYQEPLNPELAAVEAALASLAPKAAGVDRDRLMFLAGEAAAQPRRGTWLWPSATAASLLLAAGMAAVAFHRGAPQIFERMVYVPAPPAATHDTDVAEQPSGDPMHADYLQLRRLVFERGVDALSAPPAGSQLNGRPPASGSGYRQLLENLLHG